MKRPHCDGEVAMSASAPRWRREKDGAIRFSVTSDGMTGEGWTERSMSEGNMVGDYATRVLCSKGFVPTNGVTYEVAVLSGSLLQWSDGARSTVNIRAEAKKRKLGALNVEVACLICDTFSSKELEAMGFRWVIVMHKSINVDGGPRLLGVYSSDVYSGGACRWLDAFGDDPLRRWSRDRGFAFAAPAK